MKETTPEEVLKVMRHDNKKLDEQLNELEELEANLKKASELITGAVIRYRTLPGGSRVCICEQEDEFAELADFPTRESIRDLYGWDMITEAEMDRLMYLWDLREEQKRKKKDGAYEDEVTKMLHTAANAMEDKYRDRKEELEEVRWKAEQEAQRRAKTINDSRFGFLTI